MLYSCKVTNMATVGVKGLRLDGIVPIWLTKWPRRARNLVTQFWWWSTEKRMQLTLMRFYLPYQC